MINNILNENTIISDIIFNCLILFVIILSFKDWFMDIYFSISLFLSMCIFILIIIAIYLSNK